MAFSLFAPPSTNWATERRRRELESAGPYNRAVEATTRDALTAARGSAMPGRGASAARDAAQAVAPSVARLRAEQANALGDVRAGVRTDIRDEISAQNDFMNNLIGGVGGILGQVAVPLISGLGSGGNPLGGGAPAGGSPFGGGMAPGLPANGAVPNAMPAPTGPNASAASALSPLMSAEPLDPRDSSILERPLPTGSYADERRRLMEEELRRRAAGGGGLGGLASAAAPIAGMINPLAGLGLGAAGRIFG